jgi:hypothetical protein
MVLGFNARARLEPRLNQKLRDWINASYDTRKNYIFVLSRDPMRFFMRVVLSPRSEGIWLPATFFFNTIEDLKTSVLKGDIDERSTYQEANWHTTRCAMSVLPISRSGRKSCSLSMNTKPDFDLWDVRRSRNLHRQSDNQDYRV